MSKGTAPQYMQTIKQTIKQMNILYWLVNAGKICHPRVSDNNCYIVINGIGLNLRDV